MKIALNEVDFEILFDDMKCSAGGGAFLISDVLCT